MLEFVGQQIRWLVRALVVPRVAQKMMGRAALKADQMLMLQSVQKVDRTSMVLVAQKIARMLEFRTFQPVDLVLLLEQKVMRQECCR